MMTRLLMLSIWSLKEGTNCRNINYVSNKQSKTSWHTGWNREISWNGRHHTASTLFCSFTIATHNPTSNYYWR